MLTKRERAKRGTTRAQRGLRAQRAGRAALCYIESMQGKFPFTIQGYYPHMKPNDIRIWEKYVRANPGQFISCDYDIPVGPTPDWLDDQADAVGMKQGILYRKKIDVVAYAPDYIALIEVKPRAGSSALGQILGYVLMYKDDFKPTSRIVPMVVTDRCSNGYDVIFARHGVALIEVGDDGYIINA